MRDGSLLELSGLGTLSTAKQLNNKDMKTIIYPLIGLIAMLTMLALTSCAGHSVTYNGSYGRYTFDRTGLIDIEPYHQAYIIEETCK